MVNRRSFITAALGVPVALAAAPLLAAPKPELIGLTVSYIASPTKAYRVWKVYGSSEGLRLEHFKEFCHNGDPIESLVAALTFVTEQSEKLNVPIMRPEALRRTAIAKTLVTH